MNTPNFHQVNSNSISQSKQLLSKLLDIVVCPSCQGKLNFSHNLIECDACHLTFPQISQDWLNLFPYSLLQQEGEHWQDRQQEMEQWYQDLVASPAMASSCFANDYDPFGSYLESLSGLILDIGGGSGVVRHYLGNNVEYIVLDPSLDWLGTEWKSLAELFPCLMTNPPFIQGVGEYLPFPSQTFDCALAFWSLNHANNPQQVFQEVARILKPKGRFLIVLEDMIPLWSDFLNINFPAQDFFESIFPEQTTIQKYYRFHLFRQYLKQDWPLQDDHIRILESDINGWIVKKMKIISRKWIKHYLTFEFEKID
jgi:ubiquinone/menaquinone biosynthesis C-methylase UbiE